MGTVLSIQSHVAFGYVGNRAAVFPLQRRGHEVIAVNTVQFSNHTGYGIWTGQAFGAEHIADVLAGLAPHFPKIDAVLTGYLGTPDLGVLVQATVDKIKAANPRALYVCDPVMGDVGRGVFAAAGIPEFFASAILSRADVLTPNLFELALLTDSDIDDLVTEDGLKTACDVLHTQGVKTVLVTSVFLPQFSADQIGMFVSTATSADVVTHTKFPFDPAPNGGGDLTAALFTAHLLEGKTAVQSAQLTAQSLQTVFAITHKKGQRELALIDSQHAF